MYFEWALGSKHGVQSFNEWRQRVIGFLEEALDGSVDLKATRSCEAELLTQYPVDFGHVAGDFVGRD